MAEVKSAYSQRKNSSIARAAEQLFLKYGYADTSMDAIAKRANVSKQTLYGHFSNKQQLFVAVIDALVDALTLESFRDPVTSDIFEKNIYEYTQKLASVLTQPNYLDMVRIIIAETPRNPGLAEAFRTKVPERALTQLTAMLEAAQHNGVIVITDPPTGARLLVGGLLSHVVLQGLLQPPTTRVPIKKTELDKICMQFLDLVQVKKAEGR